LGQEDLSRQRGVYEMHVNEFATSRFSLIVDRCVNEYINYPADQLSRDCSAVNTGPKEESGKQAVHRRSRVPAEIVNKLEKV
jgi:hypothetical protein